MSGNPLLHCIVADGSCDTADSISMKSYSSLPTISCTPSPIDPSFSFTRRGSDSQESSKSPEENAAMIGNCPRSRTFTASLLSYADVRDPDLISLSPSVSPSISHSAKVKFFESRMIRGVPPSPSREVDISYFMKKALPRIPIDDLKIDIPHTDTSENGSLYSAVESNPALTTPKSRAPSIKSCHSSIASLDSGSPTSLSSELGDDKATALLLSRQPQPPVFGHKSVSSLPSPPKDDVILEPIRIHMKLPYKTSNSPTWGKALFRRRRE
jgi:hypothetical protein